MCSDELKCGSDHLQLDFLPTFFFTSFAGAMAGGAWCLLFPPLLSVEWSSVLSWSSLARAGLVWLVLWVGIWASTKEASRFAIFC
jgi:hypothetical protein